MTVPEALEAYILAKEAELIEAVKLFMRTCEKCGERISSTEIPVGHGDKVVHVHHFANISEAGEWLKEKEAITRTQASRRRPRKAELGYTLEPK